MTEEILDFEEAVDFNLSDNPDALNNELLDESMFDLDGTMDFSIDEQLDKANVGTDAQDKTDKTEVKERSNELENVETTPPPEEDPEELKLGLDEFDMDDPDFLKDFGDVNGGLENDGNLEDDEFWKEFGLDQQEVLDKEKDNDVRTGKSMTTEKLETDNATNTSKSSQKENTLSGKEFVSSNSDATEGVKVDHKKLNPPSASKSALSKSPEKEEGEISNSLTSSADNNRQGQQQKQKQQPQSQQQQQQQQGQTQRSTQQRSSHQRQSQLPSNHHAQQSNQNFRGRGMRRNNDWRPGNEFFNGNMSSFRSGFGPGIEGMPGMPIGQIPMGNPMIPNLNMPGPIIGPNIHVNPNFARLRPHALPFGNQMTQFPPMGSGGPPMNMMPFQGQMDIPPFHPSMTPIGGGGRGNSNSFGRSGNPAFNHHNAMSSRRPVGQQQNNQNQRTIPSSLPKRKTPVDGFEQKEPANKKSTTNGKPAVSETKTTAPTAAAQKAVDRTKTAPVKNSSNTTSEKNSKSGIPTPVNTNNISTTNTKPKPNSANATSGSSASTTSTSTSKSASKSASKQVPKTSTKTVPKLPAKTTPAVNPSTQATSQAKSTASTNNSGKTAAGSNRLTIANVDESVTKRDLQTLASTVPGGFSSITLDRIAHSAEITFKTVEGAKLFRRIHNRSQLGGSNIVINFS